MDVDDIKTNDEVVDSLSNIGSWKFDRLVLWITSFILTIAFVVAAFLGTEQTWYKNLPVKSQDNYWIVAGAWIIASLISYGSFYLVNDKLLLPLFLITSYLNALWIVVFYISQSFSWALLFVMLIVIVYFYLIVYLWPKNIWASLLLVPLEILYIYLFYSLVRLGISNGLG